MSQNKVESGHARSPHSYIFYANVLVLIPLYDANHRLLRTPVELNAMYKPSKISPITHANIHYKINTKLKFEPKSFSTADYL